MLTALLIGGCSSEQKSSTSDNAHNVPADRLQVGNQAPAADDAPLRVAIAPYQDVAMLVNAKNLGLESKYGTKLEMVTLAWEDIPNAIASAGKTVDIGFVGLTDYLAKIEKLNGNEPDPIVFVYPALLFRGGGYISFNKAVPEITPKNIDDREDLKKFLSFKIGAQRTSCFQMVIYMLAKRAGLQPTSLHLIDTTLTDGLLAAENGSLDMAAAGLPQRTEALKQHGRVVLSIDTLGVGEINGFACKASTLKSRRKDVENVLRMWFDCTNYVLSDVEHHSNATIAYLKKNASTQYTLAEYKRTISEEYFPRSVAEAQKTMIASDGKYSIKSQASQICHYLVESGAVKQRPAVPIPITLESGAK